jgi:hypothetical protein
MSKTIKQESSSDLLDQKNFEKNEELLKQESVENTPFTVISVKKENGKEIHFGVMGDHRLTQEYDDKKRCIKELTEFSWNRLMQVLVVMDEHHEKVKGERKKLKTL